MTFRTVLRQSCEVLCRNVWIHDLRINLEILGVLRFAEWDTRKFADLRYAERAQEFEDLRFAD
jgi:hypothetical protein